MTGKCLFYKYLDSNVKEVLKDGRKFSRPDAFRLSSYTGDVGTNQTDSTAKPALLLLCTCPSLSVHSLCLSFFLSGGFPPVYRSV